MRRYVSVGLAVAAVLSTATAPSFGTTDPLAQFTTQQLTWSRCEKMLECADVILPLDYSRPSADRISVRISRLKASDPTRRRGILVLNPGGPGGSGIRMPQFLSQSAPAAVYDLIGFDPRGVGRSTALNCRMAPDLASVDSRPTDADFPKWAAEARAAEDACQRSGGAIRPYINTPNTARDLDVIRAVLGEEKLNYLGYSYGTYLGAVYGSLFPQRLDRNVLDSAVHPEWVWREQFRAQAVAYRRNVEIWAEWVAARNDVFSLGTTAAEVMAVLEKIAARLAVKPIGDQNRTMFDSAVGVGSRYRPLWSDIAAAVRNLKDGSPAESAQLMARAAEGDLVSGVFSTVTCEVDWPTDVETYYEDMRVFRERYPYGFGVVRAAPASCTYRSFTPPEPAVPLRRDGYPIGVVVQAEGDTQTQYESGPAMASRLGHSLITVTDEGRHGIYGAGNRCVNAEVDRYLVDGVLPDSSSECPGDPRPTSGNPSSAVHVKSYLDGRGLAAWNQGD
ncbi:pimeloyl-ACP methyl ester carboxylesterase [Saccharothrix tamanrassetensis]|uniref:Pimeloyl-ACP methyl ester carboxylesterase n=1 Tax=Saccharothrix tamanrassetensis TaxID=1051531 RepID=A0A841CUL3_9PSEU|nr:alpha/beta hydrolase [Saccharothrix tamanrassetensis]MBB5959838.1 pimeloyl-ACP methyl ester carboxylesterase [Saccharothrix tamanrassetensis]